MDRITETPRIEVSEIEAANLSLTSDRTLEELMRVLPFTEKDLQGKIILDLGSGQKGSFAKAIKARLSNTIVVSFDFNFSRVPRNEFGQEVAVKEQREESSDMNQVEGLFTRLPFKDASFDVVISSAAMPLYLNTPDQIQAGFREVIRILKIPGKAFIGPVTYTDIINNDSQATIWETHRKHSLAESQELFLKILRKLKCKTSTISIEFIPEEIKMVRYFADTDEVITRPASLIITKQPRWFILYLLIPSHLKIPRCPI